MATPARSAARASSCPLSTHVPSWRMSLWKKTAAPSSGTAAIVSSAAPNQRRQPSNPSAGSSLTSGNDVMTLAPASGACARSQGSASPWWTRRDEDGDDEDEDEDEDEDGSGGVGIRGGPDSTTGTRGRPPLVAALARRHLLPRTKEAPC